MRTLIKNCHLVSPDLDLPEASIYIENGIIDAVTNIAWEDADNVIDGRGLIAVPGFIDIHSHGRSNYDFCDKSDKAFATIGRDKLKDGVTGFLATSLTVSEDDLRTFCRHANKYKKNINDGATLLGIHLEGPFFNPKCAGAQNPAFLQQPRIGLVDELNAIFPVKKVSYSPELPGALDFTMKLVKRGIMPSGGHTEADYECFERHRAAGMKHLTHFCNVMTPVHHLRFGMVGAGLMDGDVYVEMICDGVHLCDQMIQMIAKLKGAKRMMLITDSMRAAGMPDGDYSLGGLPVIVKDGCARLTTGAVAGSTLLYVNGFKRLVRLTGLPLSEAVRATSL
ncbi:MAG: N-acetylglucosamine-6-phosphate deacetylase, partial [Victivallales bacterium]|nr:N-acetylglucosamine-6-phosphate deacetylase [Victivallales bacterium]